MKLDDSRRKGFENFLKQGSNEVPELESSADKFIDDSTRRIRLTITNTWSKGYG
jgi:hypothetical protein